ncbi:hypothetical protein WJ0W_000363 [Paenibacillus melissococcoides]|uniref:NIPSNAP domain-containing protein n=1 Tax=Paenibacillus melissococcoides TaxID=2912268 RepID=A0ABM9FVG2_9BACL|nr:MULTISPECIES: hypothetical protein [Paenibacillus]MEB9894757.1 hypothetical protein [Bacillus cereus]CAH8243136.1 hypothetical protein WJ0W_000363 [Paenibacillus melissococcoides]CAH8703821.1 hypothetical protein WDD9_000356 [Paenibacillus melissococcoides]CAH8706889.1 hypothetical protein HTL2_001440 [Paenibacillus melissococcoides]GIO77247.1 hypothetical protein J6TS7_08570 [Paenibacillus dendritiformis]
MTQMDRIIFVEYRILPEARERYLNAIRRLLKDRPDVVLFEGTDQPNVFVEQWLGTTADDYASLKKLRIEGADGWNAVTSCIAGGVDKLHIWEFRRSPVVPEE